MSKPLKNLFTATILSCCAFSANANQIVYGGLTSYLGDGNHGFGSLAERNLNFGALGITDQTNNDSFWVYCLDPLTPYNIYSISDYTRLGFTQYFTDTTRGTYGQAGGLNYTSLFSTANYAFAAQWDNPPYTIQDANKVMNNLVELYSHAYQDSVTGATWSETALKSAAFQFAVWEILGESTYSRTSGGQHSYTQGATTAFQDQVDVYLNALNNDSWASIGLGATTNYTYTVYASTLLGTSQNFLRVTADTTSSGGSTPEPLPLSLVFMGTIAWVGSKKYQKRKN